MSRCKNTWANNLVKKNKKKTIWEIVCGILILKAGNTSVTSILILVYSTVVENYP